MKKKYRELMIEEQYVLVVEKIHHVSDSDQRTFTEYVDVTIASEPDSVTNSDIYYGKATSDNVNIEWIKLDFERDKSPREQINAIIDIKIR